MINQHRLKGAFIRNEEFRQALADWYWGDETGPVDGVPVIWSLASKDGQTVDALVLMAGNNWANLVLIRMFRLINTIAVAISFDLALSEINELADLSINSLELLFQKMAKEM